METANFASEYVCRARSSGWQGGTGSAALEPPPSVRNMSEVTVDLPESFLTPHQSFTLPRINMGDISADVISKGTKSATLARMEGNADAKQELPRLRRRPSMRGFSNFIDRVVRTVTTLPRDKNSRKYESSKGDDACDFIVYSDEEVPGVVGLNNHGNTCFINAVLQCLSNTDVLAEYFVTGQYKADLCRRSRANAKRFGTKGEITEQLALTLKSIWSRQYNSEVSSQFKSYVEKYGTHFRGNEQHDAQEFLMWLLDKVHEDLNTATRRKYKKVKSSLGRPDEVVAAETLANHLRCNASFVQDIFQAQFRSSLRCPNCRKESNTFDPFLCISIPILQRQLRPLIVTLVYANQQPRQVRMGFSVESNSTVGDFRATIAADTGLTAGRLLLCQTDDSGFTQTLQDSDAVWSIGDTEQLYCIELPPEGQVCEEDALVTLVWTNLRLSDSGVPHRFGSPYVMQVSRDVLYEDMQKLMLKEMAGIVKPEILSSAQQVPLFTVRVVDSVPVDHTVQHPLFTEPVDEALSLSAQHQQHVKLLLEWEQDAIDSVLITTEDQFEEHRTVREVSRQSLSPVTLQECLQLYTKTERLGPEDSWRCPACESSQQAEKRLSLWSIPDILVIHLKRFRQTNNQRSTSKLTALVEFPLHGLDMSQHLATRGQSDDSPDSHQQLSLLSVWSPWKRQHQRSGGGSGAGPGGGERGGENVYELYGVCNHHGRDLQSGHYTALCRNATDGNWYSYDDTRVQRLEEEMDIVTPDAYILFYQRQSLRQCAGSSQCELDSGVQERHKHWAYRIPSFTVPQPKQPPTTTATTTTTTAATNSNNNTVTNSNEEVPAESALPPAPSVSAESGDLTPARGSRLYSTLPPGGRTSQTDPADDNAPLASEEMVDLDLSGSVTPVRRRPTPRSSQGAQARSSAGAGAQEPRSSPAPRTSWPQDERMPSRPQVIVIGKNHSDTASGGGFGENIKIFVSQPTENGPVEASGGGAKQKLLPCSRDGATGGARL